MATKELKITLRFDFNDDPERMANILELGKRYAKAWYTSALLMSDKRKPDVALESEDAFTSRDEVLLSDDIEE